MAYPSGSFVPEIREPHPDKALCSSKPFGMMPFVIEQAMYRLRLSAVQERVFRYHFNLGFMAGDFRSQVTVDAVASHVHASVSAVRRAYQHLTALGLLQRVACRQPHDAREQAPSVTWVTLPKDWREAMRAAPNRVLPSPALVVDRVDVIRSPVADVQVYPESPDPTLDPVSVPKPQPTRSLKAALKMKAPTWHEHQAMLARCADAEQKSGLSRSVIKRKGLSHVGQLTDRLIPADIRSSVSVPKRDQLSPAHMDHLSCRVQALAGVVSDPQGLVAEIAFAATRGVYADKTPIHAINACLKLVRNKRWRTPYGFRPETLGAGLEPRVAATH